MSGLRIEAFGFGIQFERKIFMKRFIIEVINKLNIYFRLKDSVRGGACA